MSSAIPVPYALATPLLTRAVNQLLDEELEAELDATAAYLQAQEPDVSLDLPMPSVIRRSYFERLRDVLPEIALFAVERAAARQDMTQHDSLQTTLRIMVVVGEGNLGTDAVNGYTDAMHAYLGALSGLLQRRLAKRFCRTAGVFNVAERNVRWEPAVDTRDDVLWFQRGRLDVTVFQTVSYAQPVVPQELLPVFEPNAFEEGVFV